MSRFIAKKCTRRFAGKTVRPPRLNPKTSQGWENSRPNRDLPTKRNDGFRWPGESSQGSEFSPVRPTVGRMRQSKDAVDPRLTKMQNEW
jgi:hypothetical protein